MPYKKPRLEQLIDCAGRLVRDCQDEYARRKSSLWGFFSACSQVSSYDPYDRYLLQAMTFFVAQADALTGRDVLLRDDDESYKLKCLLGCYFYLRHKNASRFSSTVFATVLDTHLGIDDDNRLDAETERDCVTHFYVSLTWLDGQEEEAPEPTLSKKEKALDPIPALQEDAFDSFPAQKDKAFESISARFYRLCPDIAPSFYALHKQKLPALMADVRKYFKQIDQPKETTFSDWFSLNKFHST